VTPRRRGSGTACTSHWCSVRGVDGGPAGARVGPEVGSLVTLCMWPWPIRSGAPRSAAHEADLLWLRSRVVMPPSSLTSEGRAFAHRGTMPAIHVRCWFPPRWTRRFLHFSLLPRREHGCRCATCSREAHPEPGRSPMQRAARVDRTDPTTSGAARGGRVPSRLRGIGGRRLAARPGHGSVTSRRQECGRGELPDAAFACFTRVGHGSSA
jgi:hypothetical protein